MEKRYFSLDAQNSSGGVETYMNEAELRSFIQSGLKEFPELQMIIDKFISDKDHPLNVIAHLRNPKTSQRALNFLINLAKHVSEKGVMSKEGYKDFVDKNSIYIESFFSGNDKDFNRIEVLKNKLLNKNEALYGIGDNPSIEQRSSLDQYSTFIYEEIAPKLQEKLREAFGEMKESININTRVKSAEGIIDKIDRKRGNKYWPGKTNPDYLLANMTDVLGGRITVYSLDIFTKIINNIQKTFGSDNIFEKENYYLSDRKKYKTYKTVNFIVLFMDIPCEIQITTLLSSIVSDIDHNISYKPNILPDLDSSTREYTLHLRQQASIDEIKEIRSITNTNLKE